MGLIRLKRVNVGPGGLVLVTLLYFCMPVLFAVRFQIHTDLGMISAPSRIQDTENYSYSTVAAVDVSGPRALAILAPKLLRAPPKTGYKSVARKTRFNRS